MRDLIIGHPTDAELIRKALESRYDDKEVGLWIVEGLGSMSFDPSTGSTPALLGKTSVPYLQGIAGEYGAFSYLIELELRMNPRPSLPPYIPKDRGKREAYSHFCSSGGHG
jgi:hypothetical protein